MGKYVLTDSQLYEIIRLRKVEGMTCTAIANQIGCGKTTVNDFLGKRTYHEFWERYDKAPPLAAGSKHPNHPTAGSMNKKRYVFTAAQNNTYVNLPFLKSLELYCKENDAQLVVGTFLYNLNGFQNGEGKKDTWFDPKIVPYIIDESHRVFDGLVWCGELNILPTAVNPISGLHSYTKDESAIIPHAKLQLESIPTHKSLPAKMIYTTGAVTMLNYIQMKAGQKAQFHHVYGAVVAEVDADGDWFVRQINADDHGGFYDLETYYDGTKGIVEKDAVEAINHGDIHAEMIDESVMWAAFSKSNPNNLVDTLKPKYQFSHDTINFTERSPHNMNDPYFRYQRYHHGTDSVEHDVLLTGTVLSEMQRDFSTVVVVNSNHDAHFKKWLSMCDYKTDPVNALFFLKCQYDLYKAMYNRDREFSIFEHVIKERFPHLADVSFLRQDQSFRICEDFGGIECGEHGHTGANGVRGSVNVYIKMGIRYNLGHVHAACIKDGIFYAGTYSKMDMGYNIGGSSWNHSAIITYRNSKRTIVTIKNGKWRA